MFSYIVRVPGSKNLRSKQFPAPRLWHLVEISGAAKYKMKEIQGCYKASVSDVHSFNALPYQIQHWNPTAKLSINRYRTDDRMECGIWLFIALK
jgi:hypothetical protein